MVVSAPQYVIENKIEVTHSAEQLGSTSAQTPRVFTFKVSQPAASWLQSAIQRISELTALAHGWDSYSAKPVSADAAIDAVQLLLSLAYPELPEPSIVPLADGGLQLEWHRGGLDVEITLSDDESGIFIEDSNSGETSEAQLNAAVAEVYRRIPQLR